MSAPNGNAHEKWFGVALETLQSQNNLKNGIPPFVDDILEHLSRDNTETLLVNAQQDSIAQLKRLISQDGVIPLKDINVSEAASLVGLFLLELPQSILPGDAIVAAIKEKDHAKLRTIIQSVPPLSVVFVLRIFQQPRLIPLVPFLLKTITQLTEIESDLLLSTLTTEYSRNKSLSCKAILFDMDGTLVDSTAVSTKLWGEWCDSHGYSRTEVLKRSHGRKGADVISEVAPHLDAEKETAQIIQKELTELEGIKEVPGAAAILAKIPRTKWAVVTSAPRDLAIARMTAAGLPIPDILVSAEDVKTGKPSPDGYFLAAQRLGIPASECVVFEDAHAGIAAGLNAGARVIAVTETAPSVMAHTPQVRNFTNLLLRSHLDDAFMIEISG